MMQWVITEEYNGLPSDVGTIGPRAATKNRDQIINDPHVVRFRMKDANNVVCYEGYMVGSADYLAPLDDFGTPNAGCTILEILENGKWEIV